MKVVVVSHACVLPINQMFYVEVERITGWELSFIIPAVWKNEYIQEIRPAKSEHLKGKIHYIPVWKEGNIPLHLYRSWLRNLLLKEQPDAIYVHHEPYGLATAQVYVANRLATSSPIGFYAAQNIAKKYPAPIRMLERYVLSHSKFCFPVTEGALSVLREKGYGGIAEVLPLAVDETIYYPQPTEARKLRDRLQIDSNDFVIGYLGRLVEEKGLQTLIQTLASIVDQPWTCVIAGAGPMEPQLREDAQHLGLSNRIHFVGYVPHNEAPNWLSLFDVLVLPSETRPHWKEQFGRVLVEANACGTPVIGSECGEIPAVIRSTGGGLIVPEAAPQALADAITSLLCDQGTRNEFADRGRKKATTEYEQSHLASRFSGIIEKVVADSR
jgi:glycosyltransferase involved in cell wall biosynthesis